MKKTLLILAREYRLRLRRPSFWVLTLLVPLMLAALYALPVIAANRSAGQAEVLVVDETGLFDRSLRSNNDVSFRRMPTLDYAHSQMDDDDHIAAILYIPARETTIPRDAFLYHRASEPPLALQQYIGSELQMTLRNAILEDVYGLDPEVFRSVAATDIRLHTRDAASGHESFAHVKGVLAAVLAVLIVLALIVFGVQVMRSVQEEKATRVAEVVAASVHPVQLMVGKISGVALTAVTQLVLWVLLAAAAIGAIQRANPDLFAQARQQQTAHAIASKGADATAQYNTSVTLVDETVQGLTAINLPLVAGVFLAFFLLGYLLYGALLAALAARLDSDADALQWVLLLLSPLIVTLMLIPLLIQSPDGALAQWLTLVPFTAPAAAVLRLPFGISAAQLSISLLILLLSFCIAAVLAARTYKRHLVR